MTSIVYRNQFFYEALMLVLYHRHYGARYRAIADMIPAGSSVLDVCCGPAVLYTRYLKAKGVSYTGVDINEGFVSALNQKGVPAVQADIVQIDALPQADYVVMQASLYHFLPDLVPLVVDKMLSAAQRAVIIAEPVRNLSSSAFGAVAKLSHRLTDVGAGNSAARFDEASLAAALSPWKAQTEKVFPIRGGREHIYVLAPARNV